MKTVAAEQDSATPESGRRFLIWSAVLLVVVFTGLIRLRLADMPLERDEGEYAYTGQLMLQGIPPYKEAYFMKLPGTHAAYALSMAVFGQTRAGIHRGLLVVNAVSSWMIFLIGRKLAGDLAGVIAAAAFGMTSLSGCVLGTVAHATQFVVMFALAAIYVLQRAMLSGQGASFFASGLLFGASFLMKQPGAFFAVFGVFLIFCSARTGKHVEWKLFFKRTGLLIFGAAIPFGLTCLWLWRAGVFERFWFWTVTSVRAYGTQLPLSWGLKYLHDYFTLNGDISMLLWIGAMAGTVCILKDSAAKRAKIFIPVLMAVSLIAVSQGMYFRPHYFVMLLPGLALALGAGVASARRLIGAARVEGVSAAMPGWLFGAALAIVLFGQWNYFFRATPNEVCRRLYYPGNDFIESVEIADYIKSHTRAEERVAVLGSEPQLYFYSERRSATGYVYTYNLMENGPFVKQMQEEVVRQVEAARPEMVVLVRMLYTWGRTPKSETMILEWAAKYCRAEYEVEGLVNFPPGQPAEFHWGKGAATMKSTEECIFVMRRKAAPVAAVTR